MVNKFMLTVFVVFTAMIMASYYGSNGKQDKGNRSTSFSPSSAYAGSSAVAQNTPATGARFSKHPYGGDYIGSAIPKDGVALTMRERMDLIRNGHSHWGSSLVKIPDVDIADISIKDAFDNFALKLLSIEKYTGALALKMESSSVYAIKGFDISETERVTRKIYENIRLASGNSNKGDIAHSSLSERIDDVGGRADSLWATHHGIGSVVVKMELAHAGKTMKLHYLDGSNIDFRFMPASGTLSGRQVMRTIKIYAVINSVDLTSYSILVNADVMASPLVNGSRIITLSPFQVNLNKKGVISMLTKSPFGMTKNEANKLFEPLN